MKGFIQVITLPTDPNTDLSYAYIPTRGDGNIVAGAAYTGTKTGTSITWKSIGFDQAQNPNVFGGTKK